MDSVRGAEQFAETKMGEILQPEMMVCVMSVFHGEVLDPDIKVSNIIFAWCRSLHKFSTFKCR